ncbi:hypothetical protein HU200_011458 [Digitaria exilis]|uniref:Phospholipase D n=1 Tax=Digitaria exilis TaxID=1010633 RepID=A0A835FHU3_9POAL|nr:hypothetical protein HU200_011458 [Digitaria exilis]
MRSSSAGAAGAPLLLHGDLDLTIHETRGLPNMDLLSTFLRSLCLCPPALKKTTTLPSRSLPNNDDDASHHHHHRHRRRRKHQPHGHRMLPTSDAYVKVMATGGSHHQSTLARTFVFRNSEAPKWEVTFLLHLAHHAARLEFHVKDADPFGSDLIGVASLPAAAVLATAGNPSRSEWWLELVRPDGRRGGPPKPAAGSAAAIRISARFILAGSTPSPWRSGGGGIPAYFPARRGCDVRLYQDADVAVGGEVGGVPGVFEPGRCWEDMCLAVLGAQHLVYVAGWSVDTRVRLLRQAMSPEMEAKAAEVWELGGVKVENMSLGELLKYKSQEGVRVLLLVWDDKTSHDTFFIKTRGVMRTHDEDTKRFFRDSSGEINGECVAAVQVVGTLYTHHQKCVLVDTPASETTRRVTAFLGGLDLCAGRYDTPGHTLFHGLHTVFHGDVYNPTFPGDDAANKGPRQPWHDMHCRLDGPAAYDVLENFEQRWRKTKKLHMREVLSFRNKNKKTRWKEDDLLKLDRISWILSPSKPPPPLSDTAAAGNEDDDEQLALQMRHHLVCDKNLTVEQSIHTAYVSAIRSAERFVYVENQYFIGSSYAWPSYGHPGAANLVPMEIALKVAGKIHAGEPFAAYVVIPMWPEGDPRSAPAQEILFWQYQTMEMMYKTVAAAIKDGAHPQQYLNFYCLGNRETPPDAVAAGDGDDDMTSAPAAARRNGRFMVYVHSKGMIVDDEYAIVGSANINQRSLAGSRDTEIAVGAYQPEHHLAGDGRQRPGGGKVFGYRMSLWEEHLGRETMARWPEVVRRPESRECVGLVNGVARENWESYVAVEGRGGAMRGHLMRYPVVVGVDGSVGPLQGYETFPDVGGRVLGSPNNLPDYLTM